MLCASIQGFISRMQEWTRARRRYDQHLTQKNKKRERCFEDPKEQTRSTRHQVEEVLMKRHDKTELSGHQRVHHQSSPVKASS